MAVISNGETKLESIRWSDIYYSLALRRIGALYGIRRGAGRANSHIDLQPERVRREENVRRHRLPAQRQYVRGRLEGRSDCAHRWRRSRIRIGAARREAIRYHGAADEGMDSRGTQRPERQIFAEMDS